MSSIVKSDRQFNALDDLDIDELLAKLTPEEIEELNNDVDPDNSLLPPSQRCKDQTTKDPTGPFDKEKLLQYLEEKAKNEKDWEDQKTFASRLTDKDEAGKEVSNSSDKKTISTPFVKKDLAEMGFEEDNEVDSALENATEEELVDLAAILGFTGILTQEQVNAALRNEGQAFGGFNSVTKAEKIKICEAVPENIVDIEEAIKSVASVEELNLNNVKNVSVEQFKRLCEAVSKSKTLKRLLCANTKVNNTIAAFFVEMLSNNTSLETLNLESNLIAGDTIVKLLESVNGNKDSCLKKIMVCNQCQGVLGVKNEMKITALVLKNDNLTCVSADLDTPEARIQVRGHTANNLDVMTRQQRHHASGNTS